MDEPKINKNKLYDFIEDVYENQMIEYDDRHLDFFTYRYNVPKEYWLAILYKLFSLTKAYIKTKRYDLHVMLQLYLRIRETGPTYEYVRRSDIHKTAEPFSIFLCKVAPFDVLRVSPIYSETLSAIFQRKIYFIREEDEEDDDGVCLYII